jgi:hypothetical protein
MKFLSLFCAFFLSATSLIFGQQIGMNGVVTDGYIGLYQIDDQQYWWLCIEPEGTPGADAGDAFFADPLDLLGGWTRQNTERIDYYGQNQGAQDALAKQIGVISFVLDSFLPHATLNNPATLPQDFDSRPTFDSNDPFYNSLYAVQHFLAELYGKQAHVDFTNLADFGDRWGSDLTAAGQARSAYFQSILTAVANADVGDFYLDYLAQNDYLIASSSHPLGNNLDPTDPNFNWQDALVIVAPVPEPSGSLLIGCFGLALLMRRWRKMA